MEIYIQRKIFTDLSTISDVRLSTQPENAIRFCVCIEDRDRGLEQNMTLEQIAAIKVYGQTCVPYGRYQVKITKSNRLSLKRGYDVFTPVLLNVPGFDGIRIHTANWASEILGCIAPGTTPEKNAVMGSTLAYKALLREIEQALLKEEVWINIQKLA